MKLLNVNTRITKAATEYEMQEQVDLFLKSHKFNKFDGYRYTELPKIVLREFRVPEVGRISDHVLLLDNKRVINVECKKEAIDCVIHQAVDHLRWCDYSIIVVPPDLPYITKQHLKKIMDNGIGLFYWFNGIGLFEFILPDYNRKSDKVLRKLIIERIHSRNKMEI